MCVYIYNAGAGLGLATPFTTAASVSFFLKRIAFISMQNVFMTNVFISDARSVASATGASQTSAEKIMFS